MMGKTAGVNFLPAMQLLNAQSLFLKKKKDSDLTVTSYLLLVF